MIEIEVDTLVPSQGIFFAVARVDLAFNVFMCKIYHVKHSISSVFVSWFGIFVNAVLGLTLTVAAKKHWMLCGFKLDAERV